MKVIGLDGRTYTLQLNPAQINDENRSKGHLECRRILKKIYPCDRIFEEIILPGTKKLIVDFIIPLRMLILEIQGEQHYCFNKFFHKSMQDFYAGKDRDSKKKEWAEINGFQFIELDGRKSTSDWETIILNAFNS